MPVPDEPTPPGGTPRAGSRAAARERTHAGLLDAAAAVFAEKGYGAASVGEIARTAGVSVGSIYAHFAGKQDLFLALMDRRRVAEMDDARRHLADGLPSALHDLDHRVTATADDGRAALLAAEAWLYAMRDPDFGADLAAHQDRLRADLLPLIRAERARRGAAWSLTDEEVATVALGLFSGLVQHRRLARDSVPADLYGRALLALLDGLATRD
ncbi:TetR/AcrR family transcriptional regulator [Actinomycetospora lemnae]|uniref:Helix-turn-helix domain containing protein n=1 Tax=Actinomycetospora lemnae TaxID=3019891 RepID=A0ABT5SYB1_9PSEU|nr:TetR/AcrR family transcriptional regulator [Actinomycetospora sp. DW7H6]MDD7966992.1 helix-turn-helix domain containing protein [Actinomycetospora sp. DW7H6]